MQSAALQKAPTVVRSGIVARSALLATLRNAGRVTVLSAPPGSGKTVLLRSWIAADALTGRTAWVSARSEEHDPQQLWISVLDGLRRTAAASALVRPLEAAPDVDGWAVVERLLDDLAPLRERVWLVIDDVHELAADALRQLELLLLRAPPELGVVLATRHDMPLGLHRLRLEGQLTEIRATDLRFTREEAQALLESAGVRLPEAALGSLYERTEGWAAGLRLAALSLSGHRDPERFAAQFSGSERTVAEYLLAEVLERQDPRIRRLLLRTSLLERVNGELAGLLTGQPDGERILQDLEQAGAFVVSLDPARSWFRYHRLFAELLQMELRRTTHEDVPALCTAAATWLAGNGYPAEAVRQAQAACDWDVAAQLLSDHSLGLVLNGQRADVHQLLLSFPPAVLTGDPELASVVACDELLNGSLDEAQRYLALAERGAARVPTERQARLQARLAVVRLRLARQRVDLPAAVAEAENLLAAADAAEDARLVTVEEEHLRAATLIDLGVSEMWAGQFDSADRHLEQGIARARRVGSPYLELSGLANSALVQRFLDEPSWAVEQRCNEATELAERHGWGEEPTAAIAYGVLGGQLVLRGQLEQAHQFLERGERNLRNEIWPADEVCLRYARGSLAMVRNQHANALAAFQIGERLAAALETPHPIMQLMPASMLLTRIRLGQVERVEAILAELAPNERDNAAMRTTVAALRLTQDDPRAASAALVPIFDGSAGVTNPTVIVTALLLEAIARETLGDPDASDSALGRALAVAEPDHRVMPFLLHPVPALLKRYARRHTAHLVLVSEILGPLAEPAKSAAPPLLLEALTDSETRVLHYLPTHLTAAEIAQQLHVSVHTVTTHMRHLYAKLGAHRRHEAVERARALGLLVSSLSTATG